jgi:hypothetical protein
MRSYLQFPLHDGRACSVVSTPLMNAAVCVVQNHFLPLGAAAAPAVSRRLSGTNSRMPSFSVEKLS